MFIIRSENKNYDWKYKHNKVIVFDSDHDAYNYLAQFEQFAMMQAMPTVFTDPEFLPMVKDTLHNTKVIPLPDNYDKETINFSEMLG